MSLESRSKREIIDHFKLGQTQLGVQEELVEKLRADLATEQAIVKKWNCEMSKVLAGSEYINEPAAYVRAFQEKSDTIKEQAIEIRTERTARESVEKELAEARTANQILTESGVRGHEAVCAMAKERDGLAAALANLKVRARAILHKPNKGEWFLDFNNQKAIDALAAATGPQAPCSILAAHDVRLTAPLERRVVELEQALVAQAGKYCGPCQPNSAIYGSTWEPIPKLVDGRWMHPRKDGGISQTPCASPDIRTALASTPREGTEEPKS